MRPSRAAHDAGGLDQASVLEPFEPLIDDRAAERPDRPDLAAASDLHRDRPAVGRPLGNERQNRPVARGELSVFGQAYSA